MCPLSHATTTIASDFPAANSYCSVGGEPQECGRFDRGGVLALLPGVWRSAADRVVVATAPNGGPESSN